MKIRKAYKFRLKPNEQQRVQLLNYTGACRFVWNKLLRLNLDRLKNRQALIWYNEADFWSKIWKSSEEYSFLKEVPAHCLQQKLKDLSLAFNDAFDKHQMLKKLPRFKRKGINDSIRFPEANQIKIENRRIKLPKLGWIGFFKSRNIEGNVKHVTVSVKAGIWYISINVETEIKMPLHKSWSCVGIDVGVSQFAALSDGTIVEPIHAFRKLENRIAKEQRKLSKKEKLSSNWKKQRRDIKKTHCKIANIRNDFLQKLSTRLCKSHAMIVVEDLK